VTGIRITSIVIAAALIPLLFWMIATSHPKSATTVGSWNAVFGIRDGDSVVAKAKAITNFVYQHSNVGRGSPMSSGAPRDWISDPPRQINGLCGDFADATRRFCEKIGITVRIANLATKGFADGSARFDTHVLVEVFDPESQRWFLADPTFNLTFEGPAGELLGLQGLSQTAADGRTWRAVPIATLLLVVALQQDALTKFIYYNF